MEPDTEGSPIRSRRCSPLYPSSNERPFHIRCMIGSSSYVRALKSRPAAFLFTPPDCLKRSRPCARHCLRKTLNPILTHRPCPTTALPSDDHPFEYRDPKAQFLKIKSQIARIVRNGQSSVQFLAVFSHLRISLRPFATYGSSRHLALEFISTFRPSFYCKVLRSDGIFKHLLTKGRPTWLNLQTKR